MFKKMLFVALALVALFAVATEAASWWYTAEEISYFEKFRTLSQEKRVSVVFEEVCLLNQDNYRDINLVVAGNLIKLPLGKSYKVMENDGRDCMWIASDWFTRTFIAQYLVDNPYAAPNAIDAKDTTNQPTELTTWEAWWTTNKLLLGLAALALVCAIIYGAFRLTRKPFINQPPDFWSATEEEVSAAAHEALLPTAGQGFQFIGPVQRGILNGEQTGFYRGGGRQKEHFHNEPGFRARIRTSAGKEFMVHCKWACFNPCWGIEGAEFKGTFTPIGGSTQSVPEISDDTADKIGKAIGTGKEVFDEEILPAEEPISTPVTTDEPTAEAGAAAEPEKPATAESAKQVTEPLVVKGAAEIEITSGRIKVIGGEINLTFAQLKELRPAGKSGKEE